MPKCKECGFIGDRLQWTHFKYKCTGKFKNGKEYQLAYPGSKLVDETLAKKTAVTLDNLKKKYGNKEGKVRWNEYRKKQAYTNSYEYKKQKLGWTEEEFKEYNKSRSITLQNMITRYGEELGLLKWEEYCDRQKFTKTKDYLIEKYGETKGLKKYLEINLKKSEPHDPRLLAKKLDITIDEAVNIICNRGTYKYTSLLEKEFIGLLERKLGPLDHTSLKKPFGKWNHKLNRYMVYDIKHKDCIIEFNGDYWHANPNLYQQTDKIRGMLVEDIWELEKTKIDLAKNSGYRVMVIWESDFLNDKNKTIDKVIQWILNAQQ